MDIYLTHLHHEMNVSRSMEVSVDRHSLNVNFYVDDGRHLNAVVVSTREPNLKRQILSKVCYKFLMPER